MNHTPKEISLKPAGLVTFVCQHDYERVINSKWYGVKALSNGKVYVRRNSIISDPKRVQQLHRLINNTPSGYDTDHLDRNPLNNCCTNLRTVTRQENLRNRSAQKNSTSGIRGVFWHSRDKYWTASIRINNKLKWLGKYKTKKEAVVARQAADSYYGFMKP
jgi:hypothetical protein